MRPTTDEIVDLVSRAEGCVDFGSSDQGTSDEWIARAEARLGIQLPPSYQWWLKTYAGGEIQGEEIFSVYGMPFDEILGGDIVAMAIRQGTTPDEKLYVCQPGTDEKYYFRPRERDETGEYPVYVFDEINGTEELYGETFLEFLRKRILFWCPQVRPPEGEQKTPRRGC